MTRQYDNYADLITFTRASSGTYLDSDGVLKTATTNVPRIEYDADGNRLGLLIEEARTNYVRNSTLAGATVGVLDSGGNLPTNWGKPASLSNAEVEVVDLGTADGFDYIDLRFNGTLSANNVQQVFETSTSISVSDGDVTTGSVYLQQIAGSLANITSVTIITIYFASGAFHSSQSRTITLSEDRLERYYITDTASDADGSGAITSARHVVQLVSPSGSVVDITLRFAAPQFEAGSFPTSYIPTAGDAATRTADVASIPTSAFGFNAGAGTVVCEFDMQFGGTGFPRIWEIGFNLATTQRITGYASASTNAIRAFAMSNNVGAADMLLATDPSPASGKYAFAFGDNDFRGTVNGGAIVADTSGLISGNENPRETLMLGGSTVNAASQLNGHIKSIQYYPRRLSNAQLQEVTS